MPATLVPLRTLVPLISPKCPDAPLPLVLACARLAAHDFCKRTKLWREIVTATLVSGPVKPAPANTVIVGIERAVMVADKINLDPIAFADLPLADFDDTTDSRPPKNVYQANPNEVSVYPFQAGDVRLSLWVAPETGPRFGVSGASTQQDNQNQIPDFLFANHADCLAHGALAQILATPNEKFSDGAMAAVCRAEFERGIDSAIGEGFAGQQRARPRVKPHFF